MKTVTPEAKKNISVQDVLQTLGLERHPVQGDGSCLYHAMSHQVGFLLPAHLSRGDKEVSGQLHHLAVAMMTKHPHVLLAEG